MVLQGLGYLDRPGAIGVSLNHADELGFGLHEGPVPVEVLDHGREVNLEDGLVDLAHEELGEAIEAELAGALEQDDLIAEGVEDGAGDKGVDALEERLVGDGYLVGSGTELGADADKPLYTTLLAELRHLAIERLRGESALLDVAEDERAAASLMVGATAHEVEGYVERVDVGVVRVIDKRTAVLSLLDLEAHGYGLELLHALGKVGGRDAQVESYGGADDGVGDRGVVDKRQLVVLLGATLVTVGHEGMGVALVDTADVHGGMGIGKRPAEALAGITGGFDLGGYHAVVGIVDHGLGVVEELNLLLTLGLHGLEVLLMGCAEAGEHGDGGLDDATQGAHLSGLADACLEDAQLGMLVEQPY